MRPYLFRGLFLCLPKGLENALTVPSAKNGTIATLDLAGILWLAWFDMFEPNTMFLCHCDQCPANIIWTYVDMYGLRFAAPFDDLVQA